MPKIRKSKPRVPQLATFPTRLKYARERLNLTRAALAERAHLDAPRITRLEQGASMRGMGVESIILLARALDVSLTWLLLDEGEVGPVTFRFGGDERRRKTEPTVLPQPNKPRGEPSRKKTGV